MRIFYNNGFGVEIRVIGYTYPFQLSCHGFSELANLLLSVLTSFLFKKDDK